MLREGHCEQTIGLAGVYRYERAKVYGEGIGQGYPSEVGRTSKGYSVGKGVNVGLRDLRVIVVKKRDLRKEGDGPHKFRYDRSYRIQPYCYLSPRP